MAVKNKLRILEIPVTHRPRLGGNSKVNAWSIFVTIKEMIFFVARYNLGKIRLGAN